MVTVFVAIGNPKYVAQLCRPTSKLAQTGYTLLDERTTDRREQTETKAGYVIVLMMSLHVISNGIYVTCTQPCSHACGNLGKQLRFTTPFPILDNAARSGSCIAPTSPHPHSWQSERQETSIAVQAEQGTQGGGTCLG